MSAARTGISEMSAVTISRTYGSGGGEIAARLAQRLGWELVDHEILAEVAHRLGISEEEAEVEDERVGGFAERVLSAMSHTSLAPGFGADMPIPVEVMEGIYRDTLAGVVDTAVRTRHVVIVGRGSQVLLADRRDILHTRIVAPLDLRIKYVARREGLNSEAARERVQLKDRDRTRYLHTQFQRDVNDPLLYDLVVNTAVLGLDCAVDLVVQTLEDKGNRVHLPIEELGPGAGLGAYPGQPSDLRPPSSMLE